MDTNLIINILKAIALVALGMVIYRIYVSEALKENKLTKKQAYTDPLTGRGNRHLFLAILDKLIEKKDKFAVCFMDLDGFKQINDTMGHDAGDKVLIELSNIFERSLPQNAKAYRLGGDEFAVVIEQIKTTDDITKILNNLRKEFEIPLIIENNSINLEYSLGIAIYPEDANNKKDLINYADDAMYYIKEHGKNNYYFHNKVLKAKLENKNKMEKDLKQAYENNEFGVLLQPRINVKDKTNISFEALLYWKHPILGVIHSEYFIKQAEEMGLIIKLDEFVLDTICKKLDEMKFKGYNNVSFAMNISNRHAKRKDFVDRLCNILDNYSINSGEICLELTDNINVKEIDDFKVLTERLKTSGADIGINNIELKYENLTLFRGIPIDEFKVSANYIAENNENEKNLLRDIIKLARDLRYHVVVTNIENDVELREILKNSVCKIQGRLISSPLDIDKLEELLEKYDSFTDTVGNIK